MLALAANPHGHGPDDFGSQMAAFTKQVRYDDAIKVGIKALDV